MRDMDSAFFVHSVIKENLDDLSVSLAREAQLRLCEWASVAETAADAFASWMADGLNTVEAIAELSSVIGEGDLPFGSSAGTAPAFARAYERVHLCRTLVDFLAARGCVLTEDDFLPPDAPSPVVAYMRNPYADEAYDVFAEEIADLTLRYVSSFDEGVRLLLAGEVGYCLLPLEESGGLRLSTVERLLHRYDLRIGRVTPVFGPDGTADLRYALVCRSASAAPYSTEDDRYLELRLPLSEESVLSDICVLSEAFGLSLYRMQTVSFGEGEGKDSYLCAVLCGTGANFAAVLLYLSVFCRRATVVGLYCNLES